MISKYIIFLFSMALLPFLSAQDGQPTEIGSADATILASETAPAQVDEEEATLDSGNTAWMLTATALVLFMTLPGLALFYGGLVQSKNVLSVLMHCFAIACLASMVWFAVGYSLSLTSGSE